MAIAKVFIELGIPGFSTIIPHILLNVKGYHTKLLHNK